MLLSRVSSSSTQRSSPQAIVSKYCTFSSSRSSCQVMHEIPIARVTSRCPEAMRYLSVLRRRRATAPWLISIRRFQAYKVLKKRCCTPSITKVLAITLVLYLLWKHAGQRNEMIYKSELVPKLERNASAVVHSQKRELTEDSLAQGFEGNGRKLVNADETKFTDSLGRHEASEASENGKWSGRAGRNSKQDTGKMSVIDNMAAAASVSEHDRYLGTCYDDCEQIRNLLLGPEFDKDRVLRLRSATCVHFLPGRGFCDSMISARRMREEVYTPGYRTSGRAFFREVSSSLPPSAGGFIVYVPSDTTDDVLDHDIDALWENKTPFLPHSISLRGTSKYIMMPDFHFIKAHGYRSFRDLVVESETLFANRVPIVFWRGSSTSGGLDCRKLERSSLGNTFAESGCAKSVRVQVALRARNTSHIDAKIMAATDCCKTRKDEMSQADIMALPTPAELWTFYRGILDIDGLVNAWGLFWRLYSGSVVFRVESGYSGFYEDRLTPWIHYIPIKPDLSDLEAKTAIIVSRKTAVTDRLAKIANDAREALRNITYETEVQRVTERILGAWQLGNR